MATMIRAASQSVRAPPYKGSTVDQRTSRQQFSAVLEGLARQLCCHSRNGGPRKGYRLSTALTRVPADDLKSRVRFTVGDVQ
jgi:hypothetical protein